MIFHRYIRSPFTIKLTGKERNMKAVTRFIFMILCVFAHATYALDQTETGFFYPIGTASFDQQCGTWLGRDTDNGGCYFSGFYHTGVDMMREKGKDVYAVADGKVVSISRDDGTGEVWGIGNCALVIEHKTYDGSVFTAVYGHLQCGSLPGPKADVFAGKAIGKIGHWDNGDHLHFSIHPGSYGTIARTGWGKMPNSGWISPCTGSCLNTFTDPISFIQTHYAYNPSTERQTMCQGDICWEPKAAPCETATSWYRVVNPPYAQPEGSGVCGELYDDLTYITSAFNPQERIPEDHGWRKWWRAVINFFGKIANAEEIRSFGTVNTINVYTGTVVAGNATLAVHGAGAGYVTEAADATSPNLPDFIVRKLWLETPFGFEAYQYGSPEIMKMKAQFENIGDGNLSSGSTPIEVHFYLSKGYKEDPHSGDGAWKRVGTDYIQPENLRVGDTHTETEGIELWRDIPSPGIWNIVACVDHIRDDHNNGGDHEEKHESNNCSTEAVFEVTADGQVVNIPWVDFVTSSLQFLQTPRYAGDQVRFGAYVTNQGTAGPSSDIRSSYTVECPGTGLVLLADDGTEASELSSGVSAWEETLAPVTMPNTSGACTATFCADSQGAVSETDEGNNCTSLSFTLEPRPKPRLVITKFEDEKGCCTSNTGSRIEPNIWVRNDGPVAPGSNVTVIYHINSPVATGGGWWHIGSGIIEPRELPPGGTDEDYMDGNGWPIPNSSAWKKQWHTIRGCLKADGSTPVGDPSTEVCAYYTRYSKK